MSFFAFVAFGAARHSQDPSPPAGVGRGRGGGGTIGRAPRCAVAVSEGVAITRGCAIDAAERRSSLLNHQLMPMPFTFFDFYFNLGEIIQRAGHAMFATASNLHAEENIGESEAFITIKSSEWRCRDYTLTSY